MPDGTETILVVDDEEPIRRTADRALRRLGYTVLLASTGVEALDLLRAGPPVDLVIADWAMPCMGGLALYDAMRREGRTTRFLLGSGYGAARAALGPRHTGVAFLPKPWELDTLRTVVRALLDAPPPPVPTPRGAAASAQRRSAVSESDLPVE